MPGPVAGPRGLCSHAIQTGLDLVLTFPTALRQVGGTFRLLERRCRRGGCSREKRFKIRPEGL